MVANIGETLACAVMPLRSTGGLLLPASALVEVIESKDLNVVVDLQAGIIGKMQWRNMAIPLMSYETASGLVTAAFNVETKAAVVRVPVENSSIQYIAIATYGDPKVVQLTQRHIKEIPEEDNIDNFLAVSRVQIEGQLLWVPDMPAVVDHVLNQAV